MFTNTLATVTLTDNDGDTMTFENAAVAGIRNGYLGIAVIERGERTSLDGHAMVGTERHTYHYVKVTDVADMTVESDEVDPFIFAEHFDETGNLLPA